MKKPIKQCCVFPEHIEACRLTEDVIKEELKGLKEIQQSPTG